MICKPMFRHLALPVVIFAALALPSAAPAATVTVPLSGGGIAVVEGQPFQQAVVDAITHDVSTMPLSDYHCSQGKVVIRAVKRSALREAMYLYPEDITPIAAFIRESRFDDDPCRILIDARILKHQPPFGICNIVLHELGHARGIDAHTEHGLMASEESSKAAAECAWLAPKRLSKHRRR